MTANSLLGPRTAFPDFNAIRLADFLPALDRRLAEAKIRAEAIKAVAAPADFANTVAPLESLFDDVSDLSRLIGYYENNAFSDESSTISQAMAEKISDASKAIFQDPVLSARFKSVYDDKARLAQDDDDRAILDILYLDFENNGAFLKNAADKARLKEIDAGLIRLTQKFTDNNRDGAKQQAVHVTDRAELAGLSDDKISSFASAAQAKGLTGWLIVPERLMVDEMLGQAANGLLREKIHNALNSIGTQAPYDNRPVLKEIHALRHEHATLLGYPHYAAMARASYMYKDVAAVRAKVDEIAAKALPAFEKSMDELQAFAAANGGPAALKPWDVSYWAERQCHDLHGFDANEMAQYLEADRMMEMLIAHEEEKLDVRFRRSHAYPTIHPDIRVYEVFNKSSGVLQGILHIDLFARPDSKGGGAWVETIQKPAGDRPFIASMNMNLAKPSDPSTPCRMGYDSVRTLFHEQGHAMHDICGDRAKYRALQGLGGPSDFVELPSMINESWALRPELLTRFAIDSATGQAIPAGLLAKFEKASRYFGTRDMMKIVQNSLWDFAFHTTDPADYRDSETLQRDHTVNSRYAEHIARYPLTRFGHLFSGEPSGYAAGYFNYLLADILAKDGATLFEQDPYEPAALERLRTLLRGGSGGDLMKRYVAFRGRAATTDALLKDAGIPIAPA